ELTHRILAGSTSLPTAGAGTTDALLNLDSVRQGGFDKLRLRSVDSIVFDGGTNLALGRALTLDARELTQSGSGDLTLAAPQVFIANSRSTPSDTTPVAPVATSSGTGTLQLSGGLIDLTGTLTVNGFGTVRLAADGDLRATGDPTKTLPGNQTQPDRLLGGLFTSANLELAAAQGYPTTLSEFTFGVVDTAAGSSHPLIPGGSITVLLSPSGASGGPVYSVGGRVVFDAASVLSAGTIKAPLGSIVLGRADSAGNPVS